MRAEDLVFWLDTLRPNTYQSSGVLCLRHAESMIVPRHWTIDDLREPVPRLFRPPTASAAPPSTGRRRRRTGTESTGDQLLLTADSGPADAGSGAAAAAPADPPDEERTVEPADLEQGDLASGDLEHGAGAAATPWSPSFDESDDLDGLLSARSPLLARAFRGDDRPRPA
jgi:hypothetical protein